MICLPTLRREDLHQLGFADFATFRQNTEKHFIVGGGQEIAGDTAVNRQRNCGGLICKQRNGIGRTEGKFRRRRRITAANQRHRHLHTTNGGFGINLRRGTDSN